MSTVDTSSWNPDADLNTAIEGIPLNSDAGIAQTWKVIAILMAAMKGDTGAIQALMVPFSGATASADGVQGFVPAPEAGDQDKVLKGDGTWGTVPASSVAWSDVTGKPSSFTPSSHTHGNITNAGAIGSTAGFPVVTGANGVLQAGSFGTAAGTVCEGNDSRLSNARTPTSHTHGSITNDGKLGTASRVVVTDGSKVIGVSSITTTKLGYLTDVTANIQGQIDGKADDSAVVHKTGDEIVAGTKTFSSQIVGTVGKSVGNGAHADMIQTYQSDNGGNRSCTIRCTNGDGYNTIYIGAHNESDSPPSGLSITNTDGVLTGDFAGSLRLTKTQDAQGTQDNSPALSIGSTSGTHLELDGNEIMAKASGTTVGSFYINAQGGDVYIGGNTTDYRSVTGRGKGSSTIPVYTNANGIVTACGSSLDVDVSGNAATATQFSANKSVTLTGDVTGSASSKAGWSIATTVGAITDTQIAALFENDGVDPDDPPMSYPERAVLCGDGAWRYFEQIPF